ncbi:Proton-dependent oligopeptide transporter [Trema orientale]|uniref:Proton-dependent oligopeptide transporter n=1 Tax=Trema orientale TaxID=63057 RepID=A0A2P5EZ29_TREOI|nr:Proton-dependent oligopeptide transporter [Trema orientale]
MAMLNRVQVAQISESQPPKRAPGGWKSVKYILGNETFEKMAGMSLAANMVLYLRNMYNLDNVASIKMLMLWAAFGNILPLLGAFVADAWIGKFKTILYGSIASLLGMGVLTLTAAVPEMTPTHCRPGESNCEQPKAWQIAFLHLSLGLTAIGGGGIKPCNISFGADQFDTTTEKGKRQLGSFFNWYFFLFTVAIIFSLTAVVYIQTNVSWFLGFAVPTACFVVSITLFLIGRHTYVLVRPQGSIISDLVKVVVASFRKKNLTISNNGQTPFYDFTPPAPAKRLVRTTRLSFLDKAALITNMNELNDLGNPQNGWRLTSVQTVEHLKCILTSLPVLLTGVGCFIAMDQPATFGILQAIQMDRKVGTHFQVPPAWVKLSKMLTLSIWVLLYEKVFIPLTRKYSKKDRRLTVKQRLDIGIIFSIVSMVASGLVEKKRRELALGNGTNSFVSPMPVWYLILPFSLAGLVEAFAGITLMEHLTTSWPEIMRTVAGGIFFLTMSISSYVNTIIIAFIKSVTGGNGNSAWLEGSDFNKNRLDYYFYTIAALGLVNFVYFQLFAKHYLSSTPLVVYDSESQNDVVEMNEIA